MHETVIGTLCDVPEGPTMPNSKKNFVPSGCLSRVRFAGFLPKNLPSPPLKEIFLLHVFRALRGSVEMRRWTSIHTTTKSAENYILIAPHQSAPSGTLSEVWNGVIRKRAHEALDSNS
jgi:hypothetical protein